MKDGLSRFIAWAGIIVVISLALMINTSHIYDIYWKRISIEKYETSQYQLDYVVNERVKNQEHLQSLFDVQNYEIGTAIKVTSVYITDDVTSRTEVSYYVLYKADFIDTSKLQTFQFWVQLIGNTVAIVYLYVTVLLGRKELIKATNQVLDEEYKKLFDHESKVIANGKKSDLENYIRIVINIDEKIEIYVDQLKSQKRKLERFYYKVFFPKYRTKRKRILKDEIEKYEKYRIAIMNFDAKALESLKDVDLTLPVKHKEISYDIIFDKVDYRNSKPISMGYSETADTKHKIAKSPLSSAMSIFISIFALSSIYLSISDLWSITIIIIALFVAMLFKARSAINDAKSIMGNKLRALEKTNRALELFELLSIEKLRLLKHIVLGTNEDPKETNKEELPNDSRGNQEIVQPTEPTTEVKSDGSVRPTVQSEHQ
jgi:hypothetical protein